ncbi:Cof-type HAD-IIB family hydrolase [Candidatus Hepatincolaceae symbiont of Richtersius coronifer]
MIRYLFSDIDGTLLKNNDIDTTTLEKIRKFASKGNKFYLATGRMDNEVRVLENRINLFGDYRISQNGTIVKDKSNQVIYQSLLPENVLLPLRDYLFSFYKDPSIIIEVSDENARYAVVERPEVFNVRFNEYPIVDSNLKDKIGITVFPTLFLILSKNEAVQQQIKTYILKNFGEYVNAVMTSLHCLEVLNKNSSKGNAIKYIVGKEGINPENVFVVGDAENDISMFQNFTKNSFAMVEAKTHVSAHAKFRVNLVGDVLDYINKL